MSYRRAILTRWSRRDRLAVVVVAVTTAFLVGTVLLLLTAGAYIGTINDDLDTATTATHYNSYTEAQRVAPETAVVVPVAMVTDADGESHRVVGIPPDAPPTITDAAVSWDKAQLPQPTKTRSVLGPVQTTTRQRFTGAAGTTTLTVHPHQSNESIFPASWYAANRSTVNTLGPTGALVISTGDRPSGPFEQVPQTGVPLVSALLFLLAGMREVLRMLLFATVGGAVLILVVLYNITRISVRERIEAIRIIRSTGGTPYSVLLLFGLRAGLLVLAGVALGYALGVIATNGTVNLAIYLGLPVALHMTVTPAVLKVLLPMLGFLVIVGVAAGCLAAWPATSRAPSELNDTTGRSPQRRARQTGSRLRAALSPTLLDGRTLVPTTTTLTIFALIVVLVSSIGGVIAPLAATETGTVTEAGSAHPINSRIDAAYASVLRSQGIEASPEIILAQVMDNQPYMIRGANYSAFASVSNVTLVSGRPPRSPMEAVIGSDLAATLGVQVGETLTIGGSSSPGLTRVTVVGMYDAPGTLDDQLVVPLTTAHQLSLPPGTVHLIRTSQAQINVTGNNETGITVTSVSSPTSVSKNESFPVNITVENFETSRATREIAVNIGNGTYTRRVTLAPNARTRITVEHRFQSTGEYTVTVGPYNQTISVIRANALRLPLELPAQAPPNATLLIPVTTPAGTPVPNTAVAISNQSVRTNERGIASIPLPSTEGNYTITASKASRPEATQQIRIVAGKQRQFAARVEITPTTASVLTRPDVNVTLVNPWYTRLERNVTVVTPTKTETRTVILGPGEVASTERTVGETGTDKRTPPGEYTVRVVSGGEPIASEQYTVTGDDRLFATLGSSGRYAPGTGVGRAIESVFGNIQVLLAAITILAGLTTIGSTTATFAQAIHARRRTIGVYRATGATPIQILKTVLLDVCRLSVPAAVVATGLTLLTIRLLDIANFLTVFGIRVGVLTPLSILIGTVGGAVGLASLSAVLALIPYLTVSPTELLVTSDVEPPESSVRPAAAARSQVDSKEPDAQD